MRGSFCGGTGCVRLAARARIRPAPAQAKQRTCDIN